MTENGKLNMALDDIIKQSSASSRGRGGLRGRARGAGRGRRPRGTSIRNIETNIRDLSSFASRRSAPEGRWIHDRFSDNNDVGRTRRPGARLSGGGASDSTTKLLISNLDFGVSDTDVKELFGEFGPLRRAAVHYDQSARSLGSADVVFERHSDALRAMKQYNGVPLDGRPMKIQILNTSQASEVSGNTVFGNGRMRGFGGGRRETAAPRRFRGSGRVGNRGGRTKTENKPVTQEQLDAELDAYINKME